MPIPTYAKPTGLQARHLFSFLISYPSSITAAGVVTWSAGLEMAIQSTGTGTWKAYEVNRNPNLVSIMSGDGTVDNNQPENDDWTITVREVLLPTSQGALATVQLYDYARIDLIYGFPGSTTNRQRIVAVGAVGGYRQPQMQGENLSELTLRPIGSAIWFGAASGSPSI